MVHAPHQSPQLRPSAHWMTSLQKAELYNLLIFHMKTEMAEDVMGALAHLFDIRAKKFMERRKRLGGFNPYAAEVAYESMLFTLSDVHEDGTWRCFILDRPRTEVPQIVRSFVAEPFSMALYMKISKESPYGVIFRYRLEDGISEEFETDVFQNVYRMSMNYEYSKR